MQYMPPRSNTRTRRKTASLMLLLWLLALASGAANACMLEIPGGHSHQPPALQLSATGGALEMAEDSVGAAAHNDHYSVTEPIREACLKACDDGSQTLLKLASSVDSPHPDRLPFLAIAWFAEVHVTTEFVRAYDLIPERGPPARVLFSRLAI